MKSPDQFEFDFTPPEQKIDYHKFVYGTDEEARVEIEKVSPRVARKKSEGRPCTCSLCKDPMRLHRWAAENPEALLQLTKPAHLEFVGAFPTVSEEVA